jgi:hypothetical protein
MSSAVEEHVIYQIANAPMREYPYPHIYVENIFPDDFYSALRINWPDASTLVSIGDTGRVGKGNYPERFVLPFSRPAIDKLPGDRRIFWVEFGNWFLDSRFLIAMIDKFDRFVKERFGEEVGRYGFGTDALVVRDYTNYKIGPHTDAPHRLLSMLFYCPDDGSRKHLGTSIYTPLDPAFRCKGGPHYPRKLFQKVMTMEYKPNSMFAFFKTDHSFHGVDPINDENIMRDLLLYDIRVIEPEHEVAKQAKGVGIKMLHRLFGGK